MRIALVSPYWLMRNDYPPLGLGYLAAALERNDYEVKIFDFTLYPKKPLKEQVREIIEYLPEIVGITITTNAYSSAVRLAKEIKEHSSDISIVVGGPHPTIFPREVLQNPEIDYLVFGEGEYTFLELAKSIFQNRDFNNIRGLAFKNKRGEVIVNEPAPLINNLDELPFSSTHLLELERYPNNYSLSGRRMATILTSRGCPFNCLYCYKGIFADTYRSRGAENIIAEIRDIITKFGISSFYFIDDLFIFDQKRVHRFCEEVVSRQLGIEWQCLARADLVNPRMLKEMRRAGCSQIFYGIESGNRDIIRLTKGITLKQVQDALRWTKEAGIAASGYFMLALPADTKETMEETIKFASDLDLEGAMFSITTPFPGTRLWDILQERGLKTDAFSFNNAFYYGLAHKIFLNLSNATDKEVNAAYKKARAVSSQINVKSFLRRRFGVRTGSFFYPLARIIARARFMKILAKRIFKD